MKVCDPAPEFRTRRVHQRATSHGKFEGGRGKGKVVVTTRTPREVQQIDGLFQEFLDAIDRAAVDRQVAIEALEYTLIDLILEVVADEQQLTSYLNVMRERTRAAWRKRLKP